LELHFYEGLLLVFLGIDHDEYIGSYRDSISGFAFSPPQRPSSKEEGINILYLVKSTS
jgi:hypothetical protein